MLTGFKSLSNYNKLCCKTISFLLLSLLSVQYFALINCTQVAEDSKTANVEKFMLASLSSNIENISIEPLSVNFSMKCILSDSSVESLPVEQRGKHCVIVLQLIKF